MEVDQSGFAYFVASFSLHFYCMCLLVFTLCIFMCCTLRALGVFKTRSLMLQGTATKDGRWLLNRPGWFLNFKLDFRKYRGVDSK